jgi:hypothetical protein
MRQPALAPIDPAEPPSRVPFSMAKHYSPAVRQLARRGWHGYAVDFLAGKYAAHHLLWLSSGEPRTRGLGEISASYADAVQLRAADLWIAGAHARLKRAP